MTSTTTVAGRKIVYQVHEDTGIFSATHNDQKYEHTTLAGLKSSIERQLKKKAIKIPVVAITTMYRARGYGEEELRLRKGHVVGVHSGNNNLLIRWGDSKDVEQHKSYVENLLSSAVSEKTLKELYLEMRVANAAYGNFLSLNAFDRSRVDEEWAEKEPE